MNAVSTDNFERLVDATPGGLAITGGLVGGLVSNDGSVKSLFLNKFKNSNGRLCWCKKKEN